VELLAAYQEMIKVHGWTGTAATMGMSKTALEARVYEVKGSGMRVDTALLIQAHAGTTHFAEAVAEASGGTFVKLPDQIDDGNDLLMAKFNELYAELGTYSSHFAEATKNDEIDDHERALLEADVARMHRVIAGLSRLVFSVYCPPRSEA
jgi:hypothetical protein